MENFPINGTFNPPREPVLALLPYNHDGGSGVVVDYPTYHKFRTNTYGRKVEPAGGVYLNSIVNDGTAGNSLFFSNTTILNQTESYAAAARIVFSSPTIEGRIATFLSENSDATLSVDYAVVSGVPNIITTYNDGNDYVVIPVEVPPFIPDFFLDLILLLSPDALTPGGDVLLEVYLNGYCKGGGVLTGGPATGFDTIGLIQTATSPVFDAKINEFIFWQVRADSALDDSGFKKVMYSGIGIPANNILPESAPGTVLGVSSFRSSFGESKRATVNSATGGTTTPAQNSITTVQELQISQDWVRLGTGHMQVEVLQGHRVELAKGETPPLYGGFYVESHADRYVYVEAGNSLFGRSEGLSRIAVTAKVEDQR
jgi:hypothetical protein